MSRQKDTSEHKAIDFYVDTTSGAAANRAADPLLGRFVFMRLLSSLYRGTQIAVHENLRRNLRATVQDSINVSPNASRREQT